MTCCCLFRAFTETDLELRFAIVYHEQSEKHYLVHIMCTAPCIEKDLLAFTESDLQLRSMSISDRIVLTVYELLSI